MKEIDKFFQVKKNICWFITIWVKKKVFIYSSKLRKTNLSQLINNFKSKYVFQYIFQLLVKKMYN